MNLPGVTVAQGLGVLIGLALLCAADAADREPLVSAGVAKVDITPAYPIRLCGYAVRKSESEGVAQRLWAKAIALGSDADGPALLITVDNTGVPASLRDEVVKRLQKRKGIRPERVALCSSHSHTTPCLAGNLPTLFGEPLPPNHQAHVEQYTHELVEALEKVALLALKDRRPSRLSRGQGQAGFAANRRTKGGPVDHDLPVLVITDARDQVRAILANYACHCTTLGGETNQVCGDWAGYAQEYLEGDHPGAIALIAIGCGADANPEPRTGLDFAKKHGAEIAAGVNAVLDQTLTPVRGPLECRAKSIDLPFDPLPTREQWEQQAKQGSYPGYYARVNLAKLDRGETLPTRLPFYVQTWNFGDDLAMVFLAGEVVVDYSLRLKKEFDPRRLWVNAYANDVPCYIPSERVLKEGGYEGGGAMIYYDKPARLAPGLEDRILGAVHDLLPKSFLFDENRAENPLPLPPEDALASIQTKAGFTVQLAAAEPVVVDPVAIDWGPDGKLWVVEMRDYPSGMDGQWKPGSRVKFLDRPNASGRYERATVFLDNLPFATGVTAWRKGVLICTAPDILYAEDTNGDGRADRVEKLFTGFFTDNYQARVNSLTLGLDNWIYGANGLLGGVIRGVSHPLDGRPAPPVQVDIRGRDFRMNPDTGAFEPVSGLTQQGRVRDDWGNWFGCDNSTLAWHYPLPDAYIRRNPHIPAPSPRVSIAEGGDPNLLHPISRTLERFNNPQSANRVTSACGLGIYRDDLLPCQGDVFVCEPVHNLVHRLRLRPQGATFGAFRAEDEQNSEFLASRDSWFRPVQARTGPDGALWVVDMYRFVIEHPRWIPADRLAKLDVRAGDDKGRIYRVVPRDPAAKMRPLPDLTRLSSTRLVAALNTPNGTERDRVHQELLCRADPAAIEPLKALAASSKLPQARLQAICVLDGLNALTPELLHGALADPHPALRANAIRLGDRFAHLPGPGSERLLEALLKMAGDSDSAVRFQIALSLGEWADPRAGKVLGEMAAKHLQDPWMRAAILTSAGRQPAEILQRVLAVDSKSAGRSEWIDPLIATAAGAGDSLALATILRAIAPSGNGPPEGWQLNAVGGLLDAFERIQASRSPGTTELRQVFPRLETTFAQARQLAKDEKAPATLREAAIRLLGREPDQQQEDLALLATLLNAPLSPRAQAATLTALKRSRSSAVPSVLLADWTHRAPSLRQACLTALLSREEWLPNLLEALEKGTVNRAELSAADRQRLVKHTDPSLQQRARALWNDGPSATRAAVLARYQSAAAIAGDPSKGAITFGKVCSSCHALRGQGHNVGPNLAALADKSPTDFLTAILDPNAAVEPRFVAYNIETRDGRSLSGIVNAESATSLTLVQSGGVLEKILRNDIQEIRASGLSLMPEGLEQNLEAADLADLIAFIRTSPRAFGSANAEQAEAARKAFVAVGTNGLAKIISAFDQLPYPSWLGTLPMPYCRQTDGHSRLTWQTAPVPADLKPDSTVQFRLPAAMGFVSQPAGHFVLQLAGKPLLEFNVSLQDQTWQAADGKTRMTYTVMEKNDEDSNGVLLIELPMSLLEAGKPATLEVVGSAAESQRWFGVYLLPGPAVHAAR